MSGRDRDRRSRSPRRRDTVTVRSGFPVRVRDYDLPGSGRPDDRQDDYSRGRYDSRRQSRDHSREGSSGGYGGRSGGQYGGNDDGGFNNSARGRGGYGGDHGYGGGRGRGGGSGGDFRGGRGGGRGGGGFGGYSRGGGHGSTQAAKINLPDKVSVPLTGKELTFPEYRMHGQEGRQIEVLVNHFELLSLPKDALFAYDITVFTKKEGEEKVECNENMAGRILDMPQVKKWMHHLVGDGAIFDGVSMMYSTEKLPIPEDPHTFTLDMGKHTWWVSIKTRQRLTTDTLLQFIQTVNNQKQLCSSIAENPKAHQGLVFLNALLRHEPTKLFLTSDNKRATTFFDRDYSGAYPLSSNPVLEAWTGFFQSAAVRFGRLTVNVDTATVAFLRPGINFVDFAAESLHARREDLEREYLRNPRPIMDLLSKLKRVGFKTRHINHANGQEDFVRLVKRIDPRGAEDITFQRRTFKKNPETGETDVTTVDISIAEYFQEHHRLSLQFKALPCIETPKKEIFPLEVCFVAEAERWRETLEPNETADFIKQATAPAYGRKSKVEENVSKLAWHENKELKEFGVSIKPQMMKLPARLLPIPIPQFQRGSDRNPPAAGRWNLRDKVFFKAKEITSFGILYFAPPRTYIDRRQTDDEVLNELTQQFCNTLRLHGLKLPNQQPAIHRADSQGGLDRVIAEFGSKCQAIFGKKPELIVFPLLKDSGELYKEIKRICDITFGVASQCIQLTKYIAQRNPAQYLSNVALKVNNKLGGVNSYVQDDYLEREKVMLMGGDCNHPNPSLRKLVPPVPTVTALAATYDSACSKYTAVTGSQEPGSDVIQDFSKMAKTILGRYREIHGEDPVRIIYFREGITEEQYSVVMEQEVKALKALTNAQVTVVVCAKRHHTRLFPVGESDKNGNVLPGTVVENHHGKDIFLVAHPGLQGTVRPTRYICLHDENKLTADTFQRICNNICYAFGRATTAVSRVPPVYYASLACERARIHCSGADENMSKELKPVRRTLAWSMWWA